jgi:hypothetical protein
MGERTMVTLTRVTLKADSEGVPEAVGGPNCSAESMPGASTPDHAAVTRHRS